jgi:hypothetical protein
MLSEVFALIDRGIQLRRRREEIDRTFFSDVVAPALTNLAAVHVDYIETFRRYRALLADSSHPTDSRHPIFEALQTDALFSWHLRSRMDEVVQLQRDDTLGPLIMAIEAYLGRGSAKTLLGRSSSNFRRSQLTGGLSPLFQPGFLLPFQKRRRAVALVDRTIMELQRAYDEVLGQGAKLRQRLLSPK